MGRGRTASKYRALYDEDLREAVRGETSGHYGKLVGLALAPKDVFFADVIDQACGGIGCMAACRQMAATVAPQLATLAGRGGKLRAWAAHAV